MTKIKVCGMRREEDIKYINEFLPEYTGFIFAKDRRRYIEPDKAAYFKSLLNEKIKACGVFVNEDIDEVIRLARKDVFDCIQLHGQENDEYIKEVMSSTGKIVIKAFTIKCTEDLSNASKSAADMILLDNGIGGTGESFDWSLFRNIGRDFFLAGGISINNVSEAIRLMKPYAVDVSSSLETDGYKDKQKIADFINEVRK